MLEATVHAQTGRPFSEPIPGGESVDFASRLLVFDTSALEYGFIVLGLMMTVTTAFLLSVWVNMPGEKTTDRKSVV